MQKRQTAYCNIQNKSLRGAMIMIWISVLCMVRFRIRPTVSGLDRAGLTIRIPIPTKSGGPFLILVARIFSRVLFSPKKLTTFFCFFCRRRFSLRLSLTSKQRGKKISQLIGPPASWRRGRGEEAPNPMVH